jgi:hypothetical protein
MLLPQQHVLDISYSVTEHGELILTDKLLTYCGLFYDLEAKQEVRSNIKSHSNNHKTLHLVHLTLPTLNGYSE